MCLPSVLNVDSPFREAPGPCILHLSLAVQYATLSLKCFRESRFDEQLISHHILTFEDTKSLIQIEHAKEGNGIFDKATYEGLIQILELNLQMVQKPVLPSTHSHTIIRVRSWNINCGCLLHVHL